MYLEKSVFYISVICLVLTWVYLYFLERGLNRKFDHYEEEYLKALRQNNFEHNEKNRDRDREIKEAFCDINRELNQLIKGKDTLFKEVRDLKRPSQAVKEDILQNFV